jgi:DNA-binding MarR family transcriptional regulator/predicted GNAT family N-acyltransferase
MDLYEKIGKMALGSRLRRLSEKVTEQAGQVYALYHIDMQPKWFPVFYALSDGKEKSITQLAQEIGHSHPSVSTIVKEMVRKNYVKETPGNADGRKNFIGLSEKGFEIKERIKDQYADVNKAIEIAISETQYDIWKSIEEWEFLLDQKSLLKRVQTEKKIRESASVEIVEYQPKYQQAFRQLNVEWITANFKMEESDYKSLDDPQGHIIDKGGYILIALYKYEPVGTCSLIKINDKTFELAKMAVSPSAKGKGIGFLLGNACVKKAKEIGAVSLYLESNTKLKPAINLYHKLGFKKVSGPPSPYERANIQMELIL